MAVIHESTHSISKSTSNVSEEILRAVNELRLGSGFGSVEIVLHEGRVTQIEKREKLRFNHDNTKTKPTA